MARCFTIHLHNYPSFARKIWKAVAVIFEAVGMILEAVAVISAARSLTKSPFNLNEAVP